MKGFLFICTRHAVFGIFNFLCAICDSLMLCKVHLLENEDFSWNISSRCMPRLERFLNIWKVFYSYVQDIESSVSSTFLLYLRLPTALQGTLLWKKMIFSWNISSWCLPQLERILIIWQVFYPYVQGMKLSVSLIVLCHLRLSYALYGNFFWKKMIFFHEIFQAGACPNL